MKEMEEENELFIKQQTINAFDREAMSIFNDYAMHENDFIITKDLHSIPVFDYPFRTNVFIFLLCLDGSIDVEINLKSYHLTKNMVVFIEPQQLVSHHNQSEDFSAACSVVSSNFISDVAVGINTPLVWLQTPIITLSEEWKNSFSFFYDLIVSKLQTSSPYKREILKCLFKVCIYEFLDLFESQSLLFSKTKVKSRKDNIVFSFIKLVHKDFKKDRSVNYYADKLCITPKHLSKTIKELRGVTASEYIDSYVILEAKSQLKSSARTIQEISNDLNFANQSFFGKFFKHYTGMSPKKYRQEG